jgi:hypothetical protein
MTTLLSEFTLVVLCSGSLEIEGLVTMRSTNARQCRAFQGGKFPERSVASFYRQYTTTLTVKNNCMGAILGQRSRALSGLHAI